MKEEQKTLDIKASKKYIIIKGARVNNLKNIDVQIPRGQFVVVTGLSGSGKSSLAFNTLYAEGQRRYVESLSSYARQFLGRMTKPECDFILGIPPAIAIQQKVSSRNPRSTVGTSTEIYEYLRLLFARIGKTYSPKSGTLVKKHTIEDILHCVASYPKSTRFTILCPCKETVSVPYLEKLLKMGFTRIEVDGQVARISDLLAKPQGEDVPKLKKNSSCYILIDRLGVDDTKEVISRIVDSVETAFFEGDGICLLRFYATLESEEEGSESTQLHTFTKRFEADGMVFEEPNDLLFSFNSAGACPECEGFGRVVGIDESLVIPNRSLSVYDGCVVCWRGEKMGEWLSYFIERSAQYDFPIFEPYYNLTQAQKDLLWHGTDPRLKGTDREVEGIDRFFQMLRENQYKIQYRVMLARYRGKTVCPVCRGTRLKKEANYVKIGGRSITELVEQPLYMLKDFFANLELNAHEAAIAKRILLEINHRISFLLDVGLGYLTLNRQSNSLSGGESQRINLATSLGSGLVGSLYILDEPSIGLHPRDTQRLIKVLRALQKLGNTVVVVEHDEEIMRAADFLIDVGPEAGRYGGEIVYAGPVPTLESFGKDPLPNSHTVRFLCGKEKIEPAQYYRPWHNYIEIKGARENNLKGIDVRFPLNVMTVVTGVSGSGKSSLVRDVFYRALKRELDETTERPGEFVALEGDVKLVKHIELVDQNPIGKSSRSNPVTYLKAYEEIRKLMAEQPLSKQMGFTPSFFSFNAEGGRCEECKGEGTVSVPMQFMADLELVCESCNGKRFKSDLLEVQYQGVNIHDILEMTVNRAVEFFTVHKQPKIIQKLKPLQDVGLGYIRLGQSSSTLSGGESQRVKLAYYLSLEKIEPTIFVLDEPTTGLHMYDIRKLIEVFDALIARGHTLVIIEHNLEVIKRADHVIDLGPEGGSEGGHVVCCGTPQEVTQCKESYTGQSLKMML